MENGVYIYQKEKFCVPVTKAEPLDEIQFIVEDFQKKKVTFCIEGSDNHWEIWRVEEEDDSEKIKKTGMPEHPNYLYVDGILTEEYSLAE